MARFTNPGDGSGSGIPGPAGADGADALWNFIGEYDNGADYSPGDLVTYNGGTYYRVGEPNPGYPPGTSYWTTIAEPGTDGSDGVNGSPGLVYLEDYVSGNGYLANVAVVKGSDNNLYIATSSGGLGDPVGNTAEWAIFLPKGADGADGENGATGPAAEEATFVVNGGTTGTQPTFSSDPLFSGTYIKNGSLVHFQVQVDMDNITNFGTGQYYVDLPFDSKYEYQIREGCLHDISTSNQFHIGGHVAAGANRLYLTSTASNGQDVSFEHDIPVVLNVADRFHISGTYIAE